MRKFFITIPFLFLTVFSYSQQLSQVTFSGGAKLEYISFITDQNILLRVSDDGKVLEYGMEVMSNRYNYYAPKLQPFMGRIDYYDAASDSAYRGKLKSVGTCYLTYYASNDNPVRVGKLRSIGNVIFDYHDNFGDKTLKGKMSSAGNLDLQYYSSFDDEAFRGKLKSIGGAPITYYSSFDDKAIKGKIKSIGSVIYTWYTSFDITSGLKSGLYRQNIGGITYILQ